MKKFNVGDIVFVSSYEYKNGKNGINHPFVIIDDGQAIDIDYFGFLLSSHIEKATYPYSHKIEKNTQNNLQKDSVVKCDDLIQISEGAVRFKIGSVDQKELDKFINTYSRYLEDN